MSTLAFKFLAKGTRGPISGFTWPAAGEWVTASQPLELCARGIHACGVHQLAHWLHDELWIIELDGALIQGYDCTIAERARLVQRIDAWQTGGAARFALAARDHAAQLTASAPPELRRQLEIYVGDASAHLPHGSTALSAFCSAMTAARLRGIDHFDDEAYREERSWQSSFIANDLGLQTGA